MSGQPLRPGSCAGGCGCPHCPVKGFEDRLEVEIAALRDQAISIGAVVSWDGCVSESAACRLIGYRSVDTLRKRVKAGNDVIPYRSRGRARIYAIEDIARFRLIQRQSEFSGEIGN